MRHASRLLATVTAVAATIGLTPAASANGRFPSSNYFVAGPGPESRVLALRTTFGLATSYDAGRTWGWICEEALNAVGTFDASMSIGFDGTVVVGAPSGITVSRNACSYVSPMGNPMRPIVDIANDASAATPAAPKKLLYFAIDNPRPISGSQSPHLRTPRFTPRCW